MLKIQTPAIEAFDNRSQRFISIKSQELVLEHSLLSVTKWECKWKKPFLGKAHKTREETIDYIKCMTINHVDDDSVYECLTQENIDEITDYIHDPMSATKFRNESGDNNRRVMTNEVIYDLMFCYGIPKECERWHLNRLITLIRVASERNKKPSKKSKQELAREYADINERNKKFFNTKG